METIITKQDIISKYMEYVLENGEPPKSIYSFSKNLKIEEKHFYTFYTSFEHLDTDIYLVFFEEALKLIVSETSYEELDAKNRLISFYYTFFELLTNNRSYVVHSLSMDGLKDLKKLKQLEALKKHFKNFIKSLEIKTIDLQKEQLNSIKDKSLEELAWSQLMFTMKFWMDDTSASFEKTDLFIEKSVNASFDIMDTTPLENIIDFGKFFFKEKIKPKF